MGSCVCVCACVRAQYSVQFSLLRALCNNLLYMNSFGCLQLKLRSHRANERETDKKLFHPFVSGRIRFMSVSNTVNPFLVR